MCNRELNGQRGLILPFCYKGSSLGKESFAVMERDELAKKAAYLRDYFGNSGGKWYFMVSEVLERKCTESRSYRLSRFAIFFNTSKANIFTNKIQIVYKCIFT